MILKNPILRSVFVLVFMSILTAPAATGFWWNLWTSTTVRPRAFVAFDNLLQTLFIDPFGKATGVSILAFLTVILSFVAYLRGVKEQEKA